MSPPGTVAESADRWWHLGMAVRRTCARSTRMRGAAFAAPGGSDVLELLWPGGC